ncbi:CBS and ACT domain-containing protein [Macrococcus caseolyticus]|uniref:CBS and ACT domain-containing protein n=1 Tax=Macrococcoides caseolyticum TaxID=69966 RepID=UPI0024BBFB52|nr:CBS and ACT domain-containing protein [Macrococcus caseolyticus]MDJ1155426.1 CBS and ACT domain-containing protein [Macrococcus caseolyticus]
MLVERIMTSPCITFNKEGSIAQAIALMNEKNIRHLPIVDDEQQLQGIISDREIKEVLPSLLKHDEAIDYNVPISQIMQKNVITCHPLDFVADIAVDFYDASIASIPVVQNEKVVGIVTSKNMLNTFIELTGATRPGTTIQISIPDEPGIMHAVTEVFHRHKISIESILVFRDKEHIGKKIVTLRMIAMNPNIAIFDLEKKGFTVLDPFESGL